jgi:predicted PurR-regulated permease PerM
MMQEKPSSISPHWSSTTKLVVAFTFVAILIVLVITMRTMVGPLLMAFILAYLLFPVVERLRRWTHIQWRIIVTILFLIILLIFLGLLTWGGITLVDQVQNLISFVQRSLTNLPGYLQQHSETPIQIGPFSFTPNLDNLEKLGQQLLGLVQPLFSRLGSLISSIASGAATTIGWTIFVLFFSFFILSETRGVPERILDFQMPGYDEDLKRLGSALGCIWNAFLRNQLILFLMTIVIYSILLGLLGVHYFFGLAIMAGFARFFPYIGPGITWVTYGLVTYSQDYTLFGMPALAYVILVVGIALLTDNIIDSVITPRFMGNALRVHPAAIMVAVIVAASLMGVVGIVLAAPVLATLQLFFRYIFYKLFDQDPWQHINISTLPENKSIRFYAKQYWRKFAVLFKKKELIKIENHKEKKNDYPT